MARSNLLTFLLTLAAVAAAAGTARGADDDAAAQAAEILEATGIQGGFIVHLGCGDGTLTAALRANDRYQVQGLDRDPANVAAGRSYIGQTGAYGNVSIDRLSGGQLPYVDNLVNLLVAEELGDISMDEVMRVLTPRGVAYLRRGGAWEKIEKPWPDNIDEWTHYLHGPGGNAVAHDDVVGPPRHLQWLGSPRWSRHHDRISSMNAMVSARGRMFYVMDEGSRISILLPSKWTLIARDAFNGAILWTKPLADSWQNALWPLKSGPTQLARRLVAVNDRVYITLDPNGPLVALDAATGDLVRTYEGTEKTEEVILDDGILFVLKNDGDRELKGYSPLHNTGDQARVREEFAWNENPRRLLAVDAETGRILWDRESKVAPLTLTADPQAVFYHDGEKINALQRTSGEAIWNSEPVTRRSVFNMNFGPKLVVSGDVVLYAGGDREMTALSSRTGKELWKAPHAQSGYQSPEDLLVASGLVWSAPTTSGKDTGVFTGRDLQTGAVKTEFPPDVDTYWFHHRCHIAKATDRYLLPSRTGIEFVDVEKSDWDINHWVRGSCLYGVMPCNGLVYAPPHNCACYPEAKLYGINALAPSAPKRPIKDDGAEGPRLERGPAFAEMQNPGSGIENPDDWPTYRGDIRRSGFTRQPVPADLQTAWKTEFGGRLSAPVIAGGRVLVAQPDAHAVHALDESSGKTLWSFTAGGRVDSPPTVSGGGVYFGSADGWVYCLRATDGELAWRFRAAPLDRRLMAFEQLESVWPVHGSVLVQDGLVTCAAGRSNFLDGGLHFCRIDARTGDLIGETIIDETDPETGNNIQDRLQTLQMPVGLPDILSSDGEKYVFMRSQRFNLEGERLDIGPVSGEFAAQGGAQQGEGPHLFAPMGFLDDTWFHRSYWVYGRNFAGGHGGYYQAGKFAPSGRILVHDDENVYGFGRKPEYLKWTTTIEHQLFSASKIPPVVNPKAERRGTALSTIAFESNENLNPARKAIAVEAWINAEDPNGAILARGGSQVGYALVIRDGSPQFLVRSEKNLKVLKAEEKVVGKWIHLGAALTSDLKTRLYIDGELAASGEVASLLEKDPVQGFEIGADTGSMVGDYKTPFAFSGTIDEVKIHLGDFDARQAEAYFTKNAPLADAPLVLSCSFDGGEAKDASGMENHGTLQGPVRVSGKAGDALQFSAKGNRTGGSNIAYDWTLDLPLLTTAIVLADKTLFVAGPPDLIDEEDAFQRLTEKDPAVQPLLAKQDAALEGEQGGLLWAVSATDGAKLGELKLDALPVWDGIAAAGGKLFLATKDGAITCYSAKRTASAD